jgi:hypothetical protein
LTKCGLFLIFMPFGGKYMLQKEKKIKRQVTKNNTSLPLNSRNYLLFLLGIFIIIIGYAALSQGPWNSFWSLTLAPILLVLGYCVIVPIAILYRKRNNQKET